VSRAFVLSVDGKLLYTQVRSSTRFFPVFTEVNAPPLDEETARHHAPIEVQAAAS
jgi:hypothetical protein